MKRAHANLLLALTALIWGAAFIAQKTAMDVMGPLSFTAVRFLLSALVLLPFVLREQRKKAARNTQHAAPVLHIGLMCLAFCFSCLVQQIGLIHTSVTNAGFLTGLYVIFVPLFCAIVFREHIPKTIIPAALCAVAGAFLLSGGMQNGLTEISYGDSLVLLCAAGFGFHVAIIGHIVKAWPYPMTLCFIQHCVITLVCGIATPFFETVTIAALENAMWAILYAGVLSGGMAYSLQMVGQQYTSASNSAIILSAEAIFAALFGWMLMGDSLSLSAWAGCGFIMLAIIMVEIAPLLRKRAAGVT